MGVMDLLSIKNQLIKRFIGVGNWCVTDKLDYKSPKFIFSTFDGKNISFRC